MIPELTAGRTGVAIQSAKSDAPETKGGATIQAEAVNAAVAEKLSKDLRFLAFYLAPLMTHFVDSEEWYQLNLGSSAEEVSLMRSELLESGFWVKDARGQIQTRGARTQFGKPNSPQHALKEFMTMSSQIVGNVVYEYAKFRCETVVTSYQLRREFFAEIDAAFDKLLDRSNRSAGETMFSWTHLALTDTAAVLKQEEDL